MSILPGFSSDLLPNKNITMSVKLSKSKFDDLNYWNVKIPFSYNEIENLIDEEQSLASSVNLLLKNSNISLSNPVRLPSHLVTTENCQCHRSFHIFCTDLLPKNDDDIDMIYIHPAPRNHDRDLSRRVSTPMRRFYRKHHEDNEQDNASVTRSEPNQMAIPEIQLLDKKLRVPPKISPRMTSLNMPATYQPFQRSSQTSLKYSVSSRIPKSSSLNAQLQVRALSVFEQSPSASQVFVPRGPPPSPKTPTLEASLVFPQPVSTAPLRAFSITPRVRHPNEVERKSMRTSFSMKNPNYEDHAREYLSASDCSDNEKEKDDDKDNNDDDDDKELNRILTITQPKLPAGNTSLSRSGTSLRDRLMTHNANRYLSLAEVYYSPLDVYKNLSDRTRRRLRSQTRLLPSRADDDDRLTTITKTTVATKITPVVPPSVLPPPKSVFGFSKTASSMHFGHAAGRLGLQASFEKWPQPLSRRTPIERKQAVTALRLVTLPLVAS